MATGVRQGHGSRNRAWGDSTDDSTTNMQDIRSIKSNTHAGHMDDVDIPEYVLEEGVTTSTQQLGNTRTATRVVVRPQESGAKGVDMAHARAKAFWKQNPDGLYLPALLGTEGVCGKIEKLMLEFDKDGSESLNQEEFMQAMKSAVKNLKKAKQLQFLIGLLVGLAALALAAVVGITFATVYLTKEYTASADGAIMNKGAPVRVANTDFSTTEGASPPTGALRRKLQGSTNMVLRSTHTPKSSDLSYQGDKAALTTPTLAKPIATDVLRANNQQMTVERVLQMSKDELADLKSITLKVGKEGLVKVKILGYASHTSVDMPTDTATSQLEFETSLRERPLLIYSKVRNRKTGETTFSVSFPKYAGNGTDIESFRRKALADRRSLNGFSQNDAIMFAIDKVGEFLDQRLQYGFIGDLVSSVTDVMASVEDNLDKFVDWLPDDWNQVSDKIKQYLKDEWNDSALAEYMPTLKEEVGKWMKIDDRGLVCFSPLGFGTPGVLNWASDDEMYKVDLTMPIERNCGGVVWEDVEIDEPKIKAFLDRIVKTNPVAQVIAEVLNLVTNEIPNALAEWWGQYATSFFDIIERILGKTARDKIANLLPKIQPSDIAGRKLLRRELKEILDEAKGELPKDRPLPDGLHIRDFLYHPNATGPLRSAFDNALEKVARRRIAATAHEIYHIENLRERARQQAAGDTNVESANSRLHRRRLFELPSAEDVKNMFWFKTIPVQFEFSSEFVFTITLPNYLFLREGDLMKDVGMPKLRISRTIPVVTMVSVEVTLEMEIRAPYKFLAVNNEAALEMRVLYDASAVFDAATGAFTAKVDTSRDKKTGVRMVKGSVSGHGQFGLDVNFKLGVGICVATFCLSGEGEMVWNAFTLGFDTVIASASNVRGGAGLTNLIQSFDDVELLIQPPNKFVAYSDEAIASAKTCVQNSGSEFGLAGVYLNLPWPSVKIFVTTPAASVGGKDIPMGTITVMAWNWDTYDPSYVYTAIASPILQEQKMTIVQFAAAFAAYGVSGVLAGPTLTSISTVFPPAVMLGPLVAKASANFAKEIAGLIPQEWNNMPPAIFSFTTDVKCFSDPLSDIFQNDKLQFFVPFHVPPVYMAIVDTLFPAATRRNATRRALAENDYDLSEGDACLNHGETCSEHGQCCDPHATCGHVSYSPFRVCTVLNYEDAPAPSFKASSVIRPSLPKNEEW
ncbi:EF-hand domain-containing protein [Pseudoscourfieldia marina]